MTFTPITVLRQYYDADMSAAAGKVRFTPTSPMVNEGTVVASAVEGTLDPQGLLSVLLAANDDAATTPPAPFASYMVEERITGQPLRRYYVQVPADAAGGMIDLSTLNVLSDPPVVTYPAPGPQGDPGADSTVPGPAGTDGTNGTNGADGADGLGVPAGGTTGQVLRKVSGTDNDTTWATLVDTAAIADAKGDTLVATGADTLVRLAVGADGAQVIADSSQAAGLAWSGNPAPRVQAITDGASITAFDASVARQFKLVANGNRTIPAPSGGAVDGRVILIRHTAATTARTLALATGTGAFAFGSDITGLAPTASGKTDVVACVYDSTAARWWVVGVAPGY